MCASVFRSNAKRTSRRVPRPPALLLKCERRRNREVRTRSAATPASIFFRPNAAPYERRLPRRSSVTSPTHHQGGQYPTFVFGPSGCGSIARQASARNVPLVWHQPRGPIRDRPARRQRGAEIHGSQTRGTPDSSRSRLPPNTSHQINKRRQRQEQPCKARRLSPEKNPRPRCPSSREFPRLTWSLNQLPGGACQSGHASLHHDGHVNAPELKRKLS